MYVWVGGAFGKVDFRRRESARVSERDKFSHMTQLG